MRIEPNSGNSKISVAEFVASGPAELEFEVLSVNGELQSRWITSDRIQKLGLALTGFTDYIHPGRVQIVGNSEISYLSHLTASDRVKAIEYIDPARTSCLLVTKGLQVPDALFGYAEHHRIPILRTRLVSSRAIGLITSFLQEALAPQATIHGVLMGMYGLGILLLGDSGIGKSECSLDLISRGHRLISDDSVIIRRIGNRLDGDSPELTRGHLEVHGLGIINITELFGVSAVGGVSSVELCIEFRPSTAVENVERLGIDSQKREIFGVNISNFVLPVSPGRNLATLVETAVRIFLLKRSGSDAALNLIERHGAMVSGGKP